MNPGLSANVQVLPAGYRVKLPADRSAEPILEVAQTNFQAPESAPRRIAKGQPQRQAPQAQVVQHRVKRGETLLQIAQRYGASVPRILRRNNGLRHPHMVKAGTTLRIPTI